MDLTTMRALIRSELHMNSPYIDGAISDSIEFCKKEPLKFNGASNYLMLEADQYRYALPKDFISIRGDVYITPSDSSTYRYKLGSSTVDQVEENIFTSPGINSEDLNSDITAWYAIESFSDTDPPTSHMLIAPRPSTGGQTLFFRYTKDIGTPKYTATTTLSSAPSLQNVTTLVGPDGETLPSTFTNEWFKSGARLIRMRAMFYLWSTYHSGTEEASNKAQSALMQWQEELLKLRSESAVNNAPTKIRKFI